LSEFEFQILSGMLPCVVVVRVTSIKSHVAHETEINVEKHSATQKTSSHSTQNDYIILNIPTKRNSKHR